MAFILISLPSTCHTKITLASNASGIREGLQTTKERTQPSDGHKAEPNTTEPPIVLQRLLLVERRSKVAMLRGEDMGTQLKVGQLKANSKGNEGATKGNEMRGESSSVPATTEEDIVTRRRGRSSSSRKDDELQELIFPKRLMAILSDPNNIDCIQWGSEGASFYIVDREIFAAKIMPRLSTRQAKFSSFVRKLNRWGFSFVTKGPDVGHYRHDYFHRDKPFLVSQMYYHNSRAKKALKEPPRPTSSNEVAAIGALDKYERTTASRAMMQGSIEDRQRMMMSDNQNCLPFARASSSSSSRISNQPLKKRESGAQDQIDGDDHVMHELRMALHQQHKAMDGRHRTSDFLDAKNTESFSDCDDRYTQEVAMPSQEGHLWSTPDARESAEFALGPFLHELMQLRTHLLERSRINIPRHQGRNHHFPVFGTCNVDAPLATFANYRHNHDLVMAPLLRNQQGLDPRRQELLLRLQDPSLQAMLLRQEISMLPNSSRLTPSSLGTVTGGHVSVLQRSLEMQGAYSDILERMRSGEGSSLYPDPRLHPPSSSLPLIARAQLPDNSPSNDIQGIPQRQLRPNDDNTRSSP